MTKKLRKPLSFLLILSMLCSMCCITAFAQDDTSMDTADAADVVADFCDSAQDAANSILDTEAPPAEPDEPSTSPEPSAEVTPSAAPEQEPTAQPEETPAAPTEENTPAAPEQNTSPEADSTLEEAEPLPKVPVLPDGEPETITPPGVDTSESATVPETPEILVPDGIELLAESVSGPAPVPELVMPESMNSLPTPESVQAFLDAVDVLVQFGTPTEDNAEEFAALGQAAMDAYETVQDEGLESYDGVEDALMVLMSIGESVTGGTETAATAILGYELYPGEETKTVNQDGFYLRLPRLINKHQYCSAVVREFIPDEYQNLDAAFDESILKDCDFVWGKWTENDGYKGYQCLKFVYTAARPGKTNVDIYLEYHYDAPAETGYCDWCGGLVSCPANYNQYYDKVHFAVNVYANYYLNYAPGASDGSVKNMPSTNSQPQVFKDTATFTAAAAPTREGYTFAGWSYNGKTYKADEAVTLEWTESDGANVSRTLTATWEEDTPTKPTAPTRTDLYGILGNFVKVQCQTASANHAEKSYSTWANQANGHYESSVGEVRKNGDNWACNVTLYGDVYAKMYSLEPILGTGVEHRLAPDEPETQTITLKWNAETQKWVEASGKSKGTVLATFKVVCESPAPTYVTQWVNYNQNLLYRLEGKYPSSNYLGNEPTRPNEGNTKYTFSGWSDPTETTNDTTITITYTAQYNIETVTPPAKPKLTNFTKERLISAPEGVELNLDGATINYDTIVKLGTGETATLLYAITVTGEKGAEYTVSDTMNGNKAIWVGGNAMAGTLNNSEKAVIYVTMAFTREEINEGKITNTATLKPGEGTDPNIPGGGTAETPAGKTYNVTINFKTDDENPEILKDPIKDTYDNGTEYNYPVESAEGIALLADNVPANIPIRLEKDGKHYALDPVASKDALDKLTGTIQDKDVEVDLIYSLDELGDSHDGIPDKYQAMVNFVVQGSGEITNVEPKIFTFGNGADMTTSGEITIPEGITAVPAEKYKFIGWTQSPNVEGETNLDNATLSGKFQGEGGQTYTFTANFAMALIPLEPAIVRLTINIVGNTKTVTYDGQPQSIEGFTTTVTAPEGITLPENAVTVTLAEGFTAAASGTEVGDYPMNLTTEHFVVTVSDNTKYIAEIGQITDGWLKITEATTPIDPVDPTPALDVTAGNVTATYDGQPHSVSPSANKPDAQFTVVYTDAAGNTLSGAPVDAGTYTATITAVLGDETAIRQQQLLPSPRVRLPLPPAAHLRCMMAQH